MIPELLNHVLSFLSPDSLLPPSLLELSKLLKRPTLDLIMLREDAASPPSSYEGYVYSGPSGSCASPAASCGRCARRSTLASA